MVFPAEMLGDRKQVTGESEADPLVCQTFTEAVHGNSAPLDDAELNRFLLKKLVARHWRPMEVLLVHCECDYIANRFDRLRRDRVEGRQSVEVNLMILE